MCFLFSISNVVPLLNTSHEWMTNIKLAENVKMYKYALAKITSSTSHVLTFLEHEVLNMQIIPSGVLDIILQQ
jgi:hypothetical protein